MKEKTNNNKHNLNVVGVAALGDPHIEEKAQDKKILKKHKRADMESAPTQSRKSNL